MAQACSSQAPSALHDPSAMRGDDRLESARDPQLTQDLPDVDLDSAFGDIEAPADQFVGHAFAEEGEHFELAGSQPNAARLLAFGGACS